jgi:hypothetical protein
MLKGRHRVIASGWMASRYDASGSVSGGMFIVVADSNSQVFDCGPLTSQDSPRSDDREQSFYRELVFPSGAIISALRETRVSIVRFVNVDLCADPDDDDSPAFAQIDAFGIPMNATGDALEPWQVCA